MKSLFFNKHCGTNGTSWTCLSNFLEKMRTSLMYSERNLLYIPRSTSITRVWKTAGVLVNINSVTRYSKWPAMPSSVHSLDGTRWGVGHLLDQAWWSNEPYEEGQGCVVKVYGILILDSNFVQAPIVYMPSQRTILILDEEKPSNPWERMKVDFSSSQSIHHLLLYGLFVWLGEVLVTVGRQWCPGQ